MPNNLEETENVHEELALIKIGNIPERMGLQLRNHLLDLVNPYEEPKNPKYSLNVSVLETKTEFGFRKDATPKRFRLNYVFKFSLSDLKTRQLLYRDSTEVDASFSTGSKAEIASIPYIVTEERQRQRAMKQGAHEIKVLLASYFASPRMDAPSKKRIDDADSKAGD